MFLRKYGVSDLQVNLLETSVLQAETHLEHLWLGTILKQALWMMYLTCHFLRCWHFRIGCHSMRRIMNLSVGISQIISKYFIYFSCNFFKGLDRILWGLYSKLWWLVCQWVPEEMAGAPVSLTLNLGRWLPGYLLWLLWPQSQWLRVPLLNNKL